MSSPRLYSRQPVVYLILTGEAEVISIPGAAPRPKRDEQLHKICPMSQMRYSQVLPFLWIPFPTKYQIVSFVFQYPNLDLTGQFV